MDPLYNDICYTCNSKIFYTVNLVSPNSADCVFFHEYSHIIFQENIRLVYLLESILTDIKNVCFIIEKLFKRIYY